MNRSNFVAADGAGYQQQMGRWSERLAVPFAEFAGCRDDERILDMGCGTGSLSAEIARANQSCTVFGVDYSDAYVRYAAQHHGESARFAVADGAQLPFCSRRFDRALSLLVLHFVPDVDRAVSELRRVTREGGSIAAAVWDAGGGVIVNRLFCDTAAAVVPTGADFRRRIYRRAITQPGELADVWARADLGNIAETTLTIRMDFENFGDYWAPYVGGDGPYAAFVASLDEPARNRLAASVRDAYLGGDVDGPRSFMASAWAVRGVVE